MITPANIYKVIGKHDYVCSISLSPQCELHRKYGSFITAQIVYTKEEREHFKNYSDTEIDKMSNGIVKIDILDRDFPVDDKIKLKIDGINCSEIIEVHYIPSGGNLTKEDEWGFKKVPNVIEIPIPKDVNIRYENLAYSLYSRMVRSGDRLTKDETLEFIGIECALTGGRTRSEILKQINTSVEELQSSPLFWIAHYETKESIGVLTQEEKLSLKKNKKKESIRRLKMLNGEISKSGLSYPLSNDVAAKIATIQGEIEKYKTMRFGFSPLIYCDLEAYLHIALRHLPETKLGEKNANKSEIPYKTEDLRMLIQKVLDTVEDEIKDHFRNNKGVKFYRSGSRAVYFNGDYYSFDIDVDGRLLSFYRN